MSESDILGRDETFQWQAVVRELRENDLRRAIEAHRFELDVVGKLMTLSAGIVGLAIPLLSSRSVVTSPVWLWRASVLLIANVAIGAVIHGVVRWLLRQDQHALVKYYGAISTAMATAAGRERREAIQEIKTADQAMMEWAAKFQRGRLRLAVIGDVLFYGSLLGGLAAVVRSLFP
jgi:hypothetical protein